MTEFRNSEIPKSGFGFTTPNCCFRHIEGFCHPSHQPDGVPVNPAFDGSD